MISFSRGILATIASLLMAGTAFAQSESDFVKAFSGDWYVFDQALRSGENICALTLSEERAGENYSLTTKGCTDALGQVDRWRISDGRIILSTETSQVAVLGGNQFRVTGQIDGSDESLIIERAQGDGNSAKIAAALRKHTCYFLGYSQQCAKADDLQLPQIPDGRASTGIEVMVTLIARAQPRRDAPSVGNITQGATVQVNQCLTASDGPWCSAIIGDTLVWLAMTAVRLDEWPILTYRIAQTAQDG